MSPSLKISDWFKAKIIEGKGLATTIGYPTINLNNPEILKGKKEGVYLCRVKMKLHGFTPVVSSKTAEQNPPKQKDIHPCLYRQGLLRRWIKNQTYFGLLYLGPRLVLKEKQTILEIYIINFDELIYGETIQFQLLDYIRGIMEFSDMNDLKKQIEKDFSKARKMIEYKLIMPL